MINYINMHRVNDQTTFSLRIPWYAELALIDHESLTPFLFPEDTDKVGVP